MRFLSSPAQFEHAHSGEIQKTFFCTDECSLTGWSCNPGREPPTWYPVQWAASGHRRKGLVCHTVRASRLTQRASTAHQEAPGVDASCGTVPCLGEQTLASRPQPLSGAKVVVEVIS